VGLFLRARDMLPNKPMPERVKTEPPSTFKRWLKYLRLVFLSLLLLFVSIIFYSLVKYVPPISATVVDATTGKPLPGMNVCLQARISEFGSLKVLREEQTRTNSFGRFSFTASTHPLTPLLQGWEGYTIKVTDPKVKDKLVQPCGGYVTLNYIDERQEVTTKDGTPFYFPVGLVRHLGWNYAYPLGSSNRKMVFPLGAHIPLIPVLQNPEQCQSVRDSSLVGVCRESNGSAAAYFLRRASTPASDSTAH